MLKFFDNILKTAVKSQDSDKMREDDVKDSRKVARGQAKERQKKSEHPAAGKMRRDLSEVSNSSMAEADGYVASRMNSSGRRHGALSMTTTSIIDTSRPSDETSKQTATHDREDVPKNTSVQISKNQQKVEETRLPGPIEKEHEATIVHLQDYIKQMSLEQSILQRTLDQAQKREQDILREFRTQLERYQLENQELSQHLQAMHEESKRLKKSNASLQGALDNIQERAFRSMDKGGWTAPEDGKVRDNFLRLQEKIKKWAKNNALQIISGKDLDHLTIDQKRDIIKSLSGYCVPGNWDDIIQVMTPSVARKVPYLFAHAMLSKDIFGGIFENPFLTLEVLGDAGFPAASKLTGLYQAMKEIDATEAHIWRAQMLRVLQTPHRVSKSDITFAGRLEANLSRMGDLRSEQFLSGPVGYLIGRTGGGEQLAKKGLADIYTFAGQLSLSVWTQRSFLECPKFPPDIRFSNGNELMSAHAIHHLDDEEDTRLNGQPIIAVIQPAVLAFGNDDAEHYEQYKIWAEAIVLIDERT